MPTALIVMAMGTRHLGDNWGRIFEHAIIWHLAGRFVRAMPLTLCLVVLVIGAIVVGVAHYQRNRKDGDD